MPINIFFKFYSMPVHTFFKAKIIFQMLNQINHERSLIAKNMVACANSDSDYRHNLEILSNLSLYELQLLEKIKNFDTDSQADCEILDIISYEIKSITSI